MNMFIFRVTLISNFFVDIFAKNVSFWRILLILLIILGNWLSNK